jgi:hypothetical protein
MELKDTNHKVLIKFQQNCLKQGVGQFTSGYINSVWNKEEFPEEWKKSIIVPVYKKSDKTVYSNYRGISLLSTTYKFYPTSCCEG